MEHHQVMSQMLSEYWDLWLKDYKIKRLVWCLKNLMSIFLLIDIRNSTNWLKRWGRKQWKNSLWSKEFKMLVVIPFKVYFWVVGNLNLQLLELMDFLLLPKQEMLIYLLLKLNYQFDYHLQRTRKKLKVL